MIILVNNPALNNVTVVLEKKKKFSKCSDGPAKQINSGEISHFLNKQLASNKEDEKT